MRKTISILLCVCMLLGCLCGCETKPVETEPSTQSSGNDELKIAMTNFTVYDQDGKAVMLSDLKGKPVIINFWASWCDPCKGEMPTFNEAYKTYKKDINFMMICVTDGIRETMQTAEDYLKTQKYKFPVYYDLNQEAATIYQVTSIPLTIFVDAEGNMAGGVRGKLSADVLQQGIDLILK